MTRYHYCIMSHSWSSVARFVGVVVILGLTSCFTTTLPPIPIESEVARLMATADVPIAVTAEPNRWDGAVGYQFLLVVLPVAAVYAPSVVQDAVAQLSIAGAARGYRLDSTKVASTENPLRRAELHLVVTSVSASGFDFIFVRRPSAAVTLKGSLVVNGETRRECEVRGESTKTQRFAFEAELNGVLKETLAEASRSLVQCLGL